MSKKPKAEATARKPRAKKDGLQPIGEALQPLADETAARDKVAKEARMPPEYAMDKLGDQPRVRVEVKDPLDPVIERGANVDIVNNFRTSTKDQLDKLARRYQSMKTDAQGKAGEIGAMLTKAEETQNLDVWCFKEAMKWKKKSADKLMRQLPIFMKYLDDLGVVEDATAQGSLLDAIAKDKTQTDIEDAAAAAATGLAPGRKPKGSLTIVPKGEGTEQTHTVDSVFGDKPVHH